MEDAEDAIREQESLIQKLILQEQDITEQLQTLLKQVWILAEQLRGVTESLELARLWKSVREMEKHARNQPEWM